jgi:hypothetical protein
LASLRLILRVGKKELEILIGQFVGVLALPAFGHHLGQDRNPGVLRKSETVAVPRQDDRHFRYSFPRRG